MHAEDLGIGYCHSFGMGFIGSNVSTAAILGPFKRDENGTTTVAINWTKLVQRPECVDLLTITSGPNNFFHLSSIKLNSIKSDNETLLELRDPLDVGLFTTNVDIREEIFIQNRISDYTSEYDTILIYILFTI